MTKRLDQRISIEELMDQIYNAEYYCRICKVKSDKLIVMKRHFDDTGHAKFGKRLKIE